MCYIAFLPSRWAHTFLFRLPFGRHPVGDAFVLAAVPVFDRVEPAFLIGYDESGPVETGLLLHAHRKEAVVAGKISANKCVTTCDTPGGCGSFTKPLPLPPTGHHLWQSLCGTQVTRHWARDWFIRGQPNQVQLPAQASSRAMP